MLRRFTQYNINSVIWKVIILLFISCLQHLKDSPVFLPEGRLQFHQIAAAITDMPLIKFFFGRAYASMIFMIVPPWTTSAASEIFSWYRSSLPSEIPPDYVPHILLCFLLPEMPWFHCCRSMPGIWDHRLTLCNSYSQKRQNHIPQAGL